MYCTCGLQNLILTQVTILFLEGQPVNLNHLVSNSVTSAQYSIHHTCTCTCSVACTVMQNCDANFCALRGLEHRLFNMLLEILLLPVLLC